MEITAFTIIAFIVGIIIGFVISMAISNRGKSTDCNSELSSLKKEYREYQAQVSRHLQQTSNLINNIQNQYGEVQSHIFTASQELNRDDNKQNALQPNAHFVSYGDKEELQPPADEKKDNEPPRDYA